MSIQQNKKVQYIEKDTLARRGANDPAPDEAVKGILMVGTKAALVFCGNQTSYGEDSISLYPAVLDSKRCWLFKEVWCPAENYSASGTCESILPFEEGVKIFLERGVFEFPLPEEEITRA